MMDYRRQVRLRRDIKRRLPELGTLIATREFRDAEAQRAAIERTRRLYMEGGGDPRHPEWCELESEYREAVHPLSNCATPGQIGVLRSFGYIGSRYDISRREAHDILSELSVASIANRVRSAAAGRVARFGQVQVSDLSGDYDPRIIERVLREMHSDGKIAKSIVDGITIYTRDST